MPLVLNCECDCPYPTKTFAELRQRIYDGLGFIDPLTITSTRTLAELRAGVIDDLGFIGALSGEFEALADLREKVKLRLGLAEAVLTNSFTLSYLVAELMRAIGAGAQASSPPSGMKDQLVQSINEAQQTLWRRLELDKADTTLPAVMSADSDTTTLDGTLVLTWAKGLAKAHMGQPDAKVYFDEAERLMAAMMQRTPPNIDAIVDAALQEANNTIFRRFEQGNTGSTSSMAAFVADDDMSSVDGHLCALLAIAKLKLKAKQDDAKECMEEFERAMADLLRRSPPGLSDQVTRALQSANQTVFRRFEMGRSGSGTIGPFAADSDTPSSDDQPIYLLALANCMVKYKVGDHKLPMSQYEQYMQDALKRSPPDRKTVVERILRQAQEILYQRYDVFRMERWYTWSLAEGERFYGIVENDEAIVDPPSCQKTIDPRKVTWVGVSQGDVSWRALRCGIPPEVYASPVSGVPTHYEIRQCIEVWPAPSDSDWKLRIKGFFGLLAFTADSDVTSMDWQAVELQALADAKAHYNQPDAQKVQGQLNAYIGSLVAGQHHTRRYIPGEREPMNAVMPKLAT